MDTKIKNLGISTLTLLEGTEVDLQALKIAEKRYSDAVKEVEKKIGQDHTKDTLKLERTFIDYVELVKHTYYTLGAIMNDVDENYSLSYNPFERLKEEWRAETLSEEQREQEKQERYTSLLKKLGQDASGEKELSKDELMEVLGNMEILKTPKDAISDL